MSEKIQIEGFQQFSQTLAEIRDEIRRIRIFIENEEAPGSMKLNWGSPTDQISEFRTEFQKENHMSGKETDTQTVACSEMETDAAGNPVTLDPTSVTWAIDDPTVAVLTQNPDGSATFKAVKPVPPAVNPRTAKVSCTDSKTGVVGSDTLEVDDSPTQPGKMVLTFGTPS